MKCSGFDKKFIKNFKRRIATDKKLSKQFDERFKLFEQGTREHPRTTIPWPGKLQGFLGVFVDSDIRVVYVETEAFYIFKDIGSHNQVLSVSYWI